MGDPAVHVGENFALMYNGGCTPYEFAYPAFASASIVGLAFVGGGVRLYRRYR